MQFWRADLLDFQDEAEKKKEKETGSVSEGKRECISLPHRNLVDAHGAPSLL
jgi:hypothetical protein